MRIGQFEIRNFMRISEASGNLSGHSAVTVAGRNEQGKTSFVRAFLLALGGRRALPKEITDFVRTGSLGDSGITAEIAEADGSNKLKVRVSFNRQGEPVCTVKSPDGKPMGTPREVLDALFPEAWLDPSAVMQEKAGEQLETFRRLSGLDLAALDKKQTEVYDERRDVGRRAGELKAQLAGQPEYPDAGTEEVSATNLLAELRASQEANKKNEEFRAWIKSQEESRLETLDAMRESREEIKRLHEQIARLQTGITEKQEYAQKQQDAIDVAEKKAANLHDIPTEPIEDKIRGLDEINRKVRANLARQTTEDQYTTIQKKLTALDLQYKKLGELRKQRIAAVTTNIPSVGLTQAGLTLNGHPLAQASQAQQLMFWTSLFFQRNPGGIMGIEHASELDEEHLALVQKCVEDKGGQLFLQVARPDDEGATVIIENGEIVGGAITKE